MNVVKCVNKHFFDYDKFDVCPHCGGQAENPSLKKVDVSGTFAGKNNKISQKTGGNTGGLFDAPGSGSAVTPGNGPAVTPGNGSAAMPDSDSVVTPGNGPAVTPGNGPAVTPDSGSTVTPGSGSTVTPGNGPAATPGNGPTVTPGRGQDLGDDFYGASGGRAAGPQGNDSAAQGGNSKDPFHFLSDITASSGDKTMSFFRSGLQTENRNQTTPEQMDEPVVGWLIAVGGPSFGQSYKIISGNNTIGRYNSNNIAITGDSCISREKHAIVVYEPRNREFFIEPGNGGSGLLYVNNSLIRASVSLKKGDIIELGDGGTKLMLIPLCGPNFSWDDFASRK